MPLPMSVNEADRLAVLALYESSTRHRISLTMR